MVRNPFKPRCYVALEHITPRATNLKRTTTGNRNQVATRGVYVRFKLVEDKEMYVLMVAEKAQTTTLHSKLKRQLSSLLFSEIISPCYPVSNNPHTR